MANPELINAYRRNATSILVIPTIKPYVPQPSDKDYSFGEIQRYFAQQVNQKNGEIFEISEQNYSELQNSTVYRIVSLRWKIAGPADSVRTSNGTRERTGIVEANTAAVTRAAKTMPAITQKLANPYQLWRGY